MTLDEFTYICNDSAIQFNTSVVSGNNANASINFTIREPYPRIFFNNGYSLSIQCGKYNYSKPRENVDFYSKFELGFLNGRYDLSLARIEKLNEYLDSDDVAGYVPKEIVEEIISNFGGINIEKTFNSEPYNKFERLTNFLKRKNRNKKIDNLLG